MSRILGFSVIYYFHGHFDPEDLFLCVSILFRAFCVLYWSTGGSPVRSTQFDLYGFNEFIMASGPNLKYCSLSGSRGTLADTGKETVFNY